MNFIDIKEAAQLLGIKRNTLYIWCKDGKVPCHRIGRLIRFDSEELIAWAKGDTNEQNS